MGLWPQAMDHRSTLHSQPSLAFLGCYFFYVGFRGVVCYTEKATEARHRQERGVVWACQPVEWYRWHRIASCSCHLLPCLLPLCVGSCVFPGLSDCLHETLHTARCAVCCAPCGNGCPSTPVPSAAAAPIVGTDNRSCQLAAVSTHRCASVTAATCLGFTAERSYTVNYHRRTFRGCGSRSVQRHVSVLCREVWAVWKLHQTGTVTHAPGCVLGHVRAHTVARCGHER